MIKKKKQLSINGYHKLKFYKVCKSINLIFPTPSDTGNIILEIEKINKEWGGVEIVPSFINPLKTLCKTYPLIYLHRSGCIS